MIIITGAAGFIGSCLISKLNNEGLHDLVLVDDFSVLEKHQNLAGKKFNSKVERGNFQEWLKQHHKEIDFVFHLGARTDTAEFNTILLDDLNTNFSILTWKACTQYNIPLLYASSAATYGAGENGYTDDHEGISMLQPLNPYGVSKNEFDKFVLQQTTSPPFWYGIKFFNVYGPNEYHKKRMASVIFHAHHQLKQTGKIKLFRSHRPDFEDGKQLRDFVYVKDVVDVLYWFMMSKTYSGIYNLGTGKAETFLHLAEATAAAVGLATVIDWIDMPADIKDKYQYFTEARIDKLFNAGWKKEFYSLKEGIKDYTSNYLAGGMVY
ncbi:MAG: ADP-glyceromanno-heptose 6-epimerase [Chitinophagales bacterium]